MTTTNPNVGQALFPIQFENSFDVPVTHYNRYSSPQFLNTAETGETTVQQGSSASVETVVPPQVPVQDLTNAVWPQAALPTWDPEV